MSTAMSWWARPTSDAWTGATAVAIAGCGLVLVASGIGAESVPAAVGGGLLVAVGFGGLLTAGWIDALMVLALSLPLPALYANASLRVATAALTTSLVLFSWIVSRAIQRREFEIRGLPLRAVVVFMVAIGVATLVAQDRGAAVRELVNWTLMGGVLLFATLELRGRPDRAHTLALTLGFVAALCGPLAILEMAGVLPARFPLYGTSFHRAALGFGWPNEAGMYLAISIPFASYSCAAARTSATRALARIGMIAATLGLIATFSRGSWLSVLVGSLALTLIGEKRLVVRAWVFALLAAALVDIVSGGVIRERIASTIGDWVVEQRAALMFAGVMMFLSHPIAGVGPGGFDAALKLFGPEITWLWEYLPTAQNAYIQMAAETGALGLVALLILFGAIFRVLLRGARVNDEHAGLRRAVLWSFAIACTAALNEWVFSHGIGQLIMLVGAMGCALAANVAQTNTVES